MSILDNEGHDPQGFGNQQPRTLSRGKYSGVIRNLYEVIATIEKHANIALAEKDAEIERLQTELARFQKAVADPTDSANLGSTKEST